MAPFPQAEAEAAVAPRSASRQDDLRHRSARRSRQPRSPRCIAPRSRRRTAASPSPSRCCGPASSGASTRSRAPSSSRRRMAESAFGRGAAAAADRGGRHARAARSRSRWISGSKPRRCRRWPRTPRTIRISACRRSTGTAPRKSADAGMDRRHAASDHARARRQGPRPAGARPRADPVLPAPRAARRLLPCRHASRQSVRRRRGPADRGRLRHHGPARRRRSGASSPRSCYGFITRDYHRTAEVHFEAGYVPPHHSVENFAQAIRAIGEPIHNRTAEDISMAQAADAAVRSHRPVRHAHPAGTAAAAKDHGGGRRRGALARSASSTCGRPPSRWCANGSSAISVRPAGSKDAAQGAGEIGRFLGRGAGPARRAPRTSSTSSTPSPAMASCWRRKRSQRSDRPKRGATAGPSLALWVIAALLAAGRILLLSMIALIALQSSCKILAEEHRWPA